MEYFYFVGTEKIRLVELSGIVAVGMPKSEAGGSLKEALNKSAEFPSVQSSRYHTVFAAESERLASFGALPEARYITKVFYEPKTSKILVLTDEITVRFKRSVSEAEGFGLTDNTANDIAALAKRNNLQQVQKSRFVNEQRVFRLKDSPVTEVKALEVANVLNDIEDVLFAQPKLSL